MRKVPLQIIIIDDDEEMETRRLYIHLVRTYGKEQVKFIQNPYEGIKYINDNLIVRTIIVLDYDFRHIGNIDCLDIFLKLQEKSKLLYIILNTALSITDIKHETLKVFINNHLMSIVDKANEQGSKATLVAVEKAVHALSNRVDCILEEWILRHEFYTREKPYMKLQNGKTMSLNELLIEIRQDTPLGRSMSNNIISTAITLIQRDIQKLDNTST